MDINFSALLIDTMQMYFASFSSAFPALLIMIGAPIMIGAGAKWLVFWLRWKLTGIPFTGLQTPLENACTELALSQADLNRGRTMRVRRQMPRRQ